MARSNPRPQTSPRPHAPPPPANVLVESPPAADPESVGTSQHAGTADTPLLLLADAPPAKIVPDWATRLLLAADPQQDLPAPAETEHEKAADEAQMKALQSEWLALQRPEIPRDATRCVTLEAPLRRTRAYAKRHLHDLSPRHAQALRDLADGLNAEGLALLGRRIETPEHALAWLLEQLAA